MPSVSVNLLGSITSIDGPIVVGGKYHGDGYYGYSDGLHTVAFFVDGFIGSIILQGTLASDPSESDWATIDSATLTATVATTSASTVNLTGNYVWIRAKVIDFTAGSIEKIQYNH